MKTYRVYLEFKGRDEDEIWKQADEVILLALREESTVSNTMAIEEIKKGCKTWV